MNALPAGNIQMAASCGAFFALRQAGTTSYYDATSTALVAAVVDLEAGACLGGPSDFAPVAADACGFTPCGPMNCGGPPDAGAGAGR